MKYSTQVFAFVAGGSSAFLYGLHLAWMAAVLHRIEDSALTPLDHALEKKEVELLSFLIVSGVVGMMFAGSIANRFGRRTMLIICAILNTVAWSMVILTNNFTVLCVAKTIGAQSVSMSFPAAVVYLSEVASVEIRGAGITFCVFFINFGILSMYIMGPLASYNFISWMAVCSSVINLILSIFMPESPTFYMIREDRDKAIKSLKFLKRNITELEKDKECLEVMLESKTSGYVVAKARGIFFVKRNLKSFVIVAFIYVAQQMSGINAILFNMPKIFETAGSSIQPHIATIIVGLTQIVACAVAMLLVDWVGRKPLLLASAGATAVTNFLMGLNYYWMHINSSIVENTKILPIICLLLFIIFFTIGFGTVPHSLMGELLDPSIKGLASSIICCIDILFLMLIVSTFEVMNSALGNYGAFWVYSSCCLVTFVVVLVAVPEGKGKTFGEIQVMLKLSVREYMV